MGGRVRRLVALACPRTGLLRSVSASDAMHLIARSSCGANERSATMWLLPESMCKMATSPARSSLTKPVICGRREHISGSCIAIKTDVAATFQCRGDALPPSGSGMCSASGGAEASGARPRPAAQYPPSTRCPSTDGARGAQSDRSGALLGSARRSAQKELFAAGDNASTPAPNPNPADCSSSLSLTVVAAPITCCHCSPARRHLARQRTPLAPLPSAYRWLKLMGSGSHMPGPVPASLREGLLVTRFAGSQV
mmetsp:Transcript_3791/g.8248  ORF Transcript_3791/g.8248 Transcript_3791/m.8248 type:complete len:253 (-) Transcript_3791:174-932(-)